MSQENIEVVKRIYTEVSARAGEPPAPELFDPDFEVDLSNAAPDVGVVAGVEASETALRSYTETFQDFRIELLDVVHVDEDCVVTAVRDGGRLKGSEREVWNQFFHVWQFRDGRVTHRSSHLTRKQALEAAGLSE